MTKKHFEEFARYIRERGVSDLVKKELAIMVAQVAANNNSRFDSSKFFEAAGVAK